MADTPPRWSLNALLSAPDGPDAKKALRNFEQAVRKVEAWRPKLSKTMSAKSFMELLADYEALQLEGVRLGAYSQLKFSENTQDQAALAFMTQIEDVLTKAQNRTLFFSLWWKNLDDINARRLTRITGDVRYWLEAMRHFRPHTLSEAEEKLINLKDLNGVRAMETLYETITNKFVYTLEVNGEKKSLTRDALMVYARQADPALRAAAYQEQFRVYAENGPALAQIYSALARNWRSEHVDLRKYKTPIAVRNLVNDIPDEVTDTLLKVIAKNASVFQRYFKLKAKWLGVPKLRRYDLYAPFAAAEKTYPYEVGVKMVLDSFQHFSPRVSELARKVFDDGHVDAEVRPGKRGGAFCAGILPGVSPWVLLNYNGRAGDVATMAHEMGHAIHALLAAQHSILTFHSALPMAETASVFAEMVLTEKLLAEETDPAVRRDILSKAIDDTYATVGRQGFFAMWEKEAHELVSQGKTAEEMSERYLALLKTQFGDAMDVSDDFRWEWVAIPHFYNVPFYVYAYSFGQLLVLSLYQMYKREGEAFKPKYLKILSYGGSEAPAKILKEAGIDITSAKFWQGGYDAISKMVDELEKLAK